jgi:hypothetical protein
MEMRAKGHVRRCALRGNDIERQGPHHAAARSVPASGLSTANNKVHAGHHGRLPDDLDTKGLAMTTTIPTSIPTRLRQASLAALLGAAITLGTTAFGSPAPATAKPATNKQIDAFNDCWDAYKARGESDVNASFDCCVVAGLPWVGGYPGGYCDTTQAQGTPTGPGGPLPPSQLSPDGPVGPAPSPAGPAPVPGQIVG